MPRIVTLFLVVAAVLAIAVAAGCIAQPTVAVEEVRVGTFTPANTTLQVGVQVANPNSFDIPLQDVAFTVYSVESGGLRRLGEGRTGPFTLPARQAIAREIPVTLDNEALLETALVAVRTGQDRVTFRVAGTVTGDLYGLVTVDVPFEQDRAVTLQELVRNAGLPVSEADVREALDAVRTIASGVLSGVAVRAG